MHNLGDIPQDVLQSSWVQGHDLGRGVHLGGCALDGGEVDAAHIANVLCEDHIWPELSKLGGVEVVKSLAFRQGLR